ncbi:MAG: small multi-drug export protein [Methanocorpusculum sp.]|nr:small multi-drug export protein [Methanocorpusculum sp.]
MAEETRTAREWAWIIGRRALLLAGPIVIYLALLAFFWLVFPPKNGVFSLPPSPEYLVFIGLMIAYLVPPFGKETIIPAALLGGEAVVGLVSGFIGVPMDPAYLTGYPLWTVAVGIIGMDIAVSMFITYNFDLLLKIPLVGSWLRWIMRSADAVIRKKTWIEELSSAGLLIFMYIPLQGSGAMTTSVIARLLNYRPLQAVGLVTFGSVLSTLTVAFGVTSLVQLWYVNPILAIIAGIAIAAGILCLAYFWNRITRRMIAARKSP